MMDASGPLAHVRGPIPASDQAGVSERPEAKEKRVETEVEGVVEGVAAVKLGSENGSLECPTPPSSDGNVRDCDNDKRAPVSR